MRGPLKKDLGDAVKFLTPARFVYFIDQTENDYFALLGVFDEKL